MDALGKLQQFRAERSENNVLHLVFDMHCLNTLLACNIALAGRFGLDANDTMLVCSPLGHMTGFAAGMMLGFKIGASIIFQDVWEPKRGIAIMKKWVPNDNPGDFVALSGYINVQGIVQAITKCGDDLTRENLLKQATSMASIQ